MKRRVSNTCHSFILALGEAHVRPFAVFSTGCQVTREVHVKWLTPCTCFLTCPMYPERFQTGRFSTITQEQCASTLTLERGIGAGLEATLSYKEDHERILTQGCFYFHIQPVQRPCHNLKRCEGLGRLQSFWHK